MRAQLDVRIAEIRSYLEALNPLLIRERLEPAMLDDEGAKTHTGFAAPGNRSTDMPARQETFARMTLTDAVRTVLQSMGKQHADEIARRVFVIDSKHALARAKQTLVSTLANGYRKGKWDRVGPNEYALMTTESSQPAVANGATSHELMFTR